MQIKQKEQKLNESEINSQNCNLYRIYGNNKFKTIVKPFFFLWRTIEIYNERNDLNDSIDQSKHFHSHVVVVVEKYILFIRSTIGTSLCK